MAFRYFRRCNANLRRYWAALRERRLIWPLLRGTCDCGASGSPAIGLSARPEEGLDRLDEAVKLADTTKVRFAEAEMHRLRGTLLLSVNEKATTGESLRHALAVARGRAARVFELRAATNLVRFWRDQGECAEARNLLAPIYGWFTEGFDTPRS